ASRSAGPTSWRWCGRWCARTRRYRTTSCGWRRDGPDAGRALLGRHRVGVRPHALLDPGVGLLQPVAQLLRRRPAEALADQPVVGVAAAYADRAGDVPLADRLAGDVGDHVDQLV